MFQGGPGLGFGPRIFITTGWRNPVNAIFFRRIGFECQIEDNKNGI
jgi:hypothetical protein